MKLWSLYNHKIMICHFAHFNLIYVKLFFLILDGMSARKASVSFGVPRSTIGDKINGRSEVKVLNRGNKQIMLIEIEDR